MHVSYVLQTIGIPQSVQLFSRMVLRLLWYVVSPHALQQSLNNFETPQAVERTQPHIGHHEKHGAHFTYLYIISNLHT